jgi:MFS family permease
MNGILATLVNNFSPLRLPNFRIYLGGQVLSLVGTWLQVTAQGWVVWEITGSEAALGTVTMVNTIPLLVLTPWAGVWADRIDRRKLLIGTQIGAMLLAFMLAFLVQTNTVQLWHIYVISTLLGIITALDLPAQQAFLGDLAGMQEVRRAVNLNAIIIQVSRMMGPAVAGIVIARIGTAPAFWVNGISFLAVILSLLAVRSQQVKSSSTGESPIRQLKDALRFVREQPRIQDMFLFASMMTFFVWSIIFNLLPSVADTVLGGDAETLGTLMAASGAGALAGALVIVPLTQVRRRVGMVLATSAIWIGLWVLLMSQSTWLPLSVVALFMGSVAMPVIFTMGLGLIQVMAPGNMRARLISLFTMLSFGLQPLAAIFVGFNAEHFGVQQTITFNAFAVLILTTFIMVSRPALRHWEVQIKPTEPMPKPEMAA